MTDIKSHMMQAILLNILIIQRQHDTKARITFMKNMKKQDRLDKKEKIRRMLLTKRMLDHKMKMGIYFSTFLNLVTFRQ